MSKAQKKARRKLYQRIGDLSATAGPEDVGKLADAYAKVTFGAYGRQDQNIRHREPLRGGVGFE
jgi:hypothetical protein